MSSLFGPDDGESPEAVQSRWQNLFLRGATVAPIPPGPFLLDFEGVETPGVYPEQYLAEFGIEIVGGTVRGQFPETNACLLPTPVNYLSNNGGAAGANLYINFNVRPLVFGVSFWYANRLNAFSWWICEGLDGTGAILDGPINVPGLGTNGPPDCAYSLWDITSSNVFAGEARSIVIDCVPDFTALDNFEGVLG